MQRICIGILSLSLLFLTSSYAKNLAIQLDVNGVIGPATQDYVLRGLEYAKEQQAELVILRMDSSGGLESARRRINKAILSSSIPVVTYISPEGARAASAGTYILYASHVAAMAPGANLGAATPVDSVETGATLKKKSVNDASAHIRNLAQIHGRNPVWAEQSVSLSANEALKLDVIDLIASSIPELLQQINGRTLQLSDSVKILNTDNLQNIVFNTDLRYQFLTLITDPSIAYVLLLIGIYGLFFEFYNPEFILPGVAGAICLLLALYAFQLLPINYAGFTLVILGIMFLIIEVIVGSFGVIGVGGVIAFVLGSIFLLNDNQAGFGIAWPLILFMTLISTGFTLSLISLSEEHTEF